MDVNTGQVQEPVSSNLLRYDAGLLDGAYGGIDEAQY